MEPEAGCGTIAFVKAAIQVVIMAAIFMLNEVNRKLHQELGIPENYGAEGQLPCFPEAATLVDVGPNLVGTMQRLAPQAAEAWRLMSAAAGHDGIRLLLVSGFRDYEYQAALIRRKLEAGEEIAAILTVNAAPGFSQHHTGCAIDIATPGCRPLTEAFEESAAFEWLTGNAAEFGFSMTYPRNNPWGFIYEPWHWALNALIEPKNG